MKQRLIGAIVLIALAVIFLPMLVQGPAPDSGVADVPLTIPEQPDHPVQTRDLPLVAPQAGQGSVLDLQTGPGADPDRVATVDTAQVQADAQAALPAAVAAGDYAVHFGSYGSFADARRVVDALLQSQLPGRSEQITLNGKPAWRVRIGPYATRAEAESARLRAAHVRDDVGARVVVLDAQTAPAPARANATATPAAIKTEALPPDAGKPAQAAPAAAQSRPDVASAQAKPPAATTQPPATSKPSVPVAAAPAPAPDKPAASNTGFAVQLGAFSNAAEAEKLRDRARGAGMSAFVEQVKTDKGTLSRVRIGPVLNRADADALKAQAKAQLGVDGIVRPHP